LVCSGRSRPYERYGIPASSPGKTSFKATINPTSSATIPHPAVAIANSRTLALS
jgi:hypothetical protein